MLILWSESPQTIRSWRNFRVPSAAIAVFILLRLAVSATDWFTAESRIADERIFYSPTTSLITRLKGHDIREDVRVQEGLSLAEEARTLAVRDPHTRFVHVNPYVGMKGYYAGPQVTLVDSLGLADPLIARLGVLHPETWRIGHGLRRVPEGYTDILRNGSSTTIDPSLSEYYCHLYTVIAGPLWTRERLRTIFDFNLGRHDHLIRAYEAKNPWDFGKTTGG